MDFASTSDKPDASDNNDPVRRFSYSDAVSARRATQQTLPIKEDKRALKKRVQHFACQDVEL